MEHENSRNYLPNNIFNVQCERDDVTNQYDNEQNIELNKETNKNCQEKSFRKRHQDYNIHTLL